jgi:hypothetical protein
VGSGPQVALIHNILYSPSSIPLMSIVLFVCPVCPMTSLKNNKNDLKHKNICIEVVYKESHKWH